MGVVQPQVSLGEGLERIGGKLTLAPQIVDAGESQGAVQQQGAPGIHIAFVGKAPSQAFQHGFHRGLRIVLCQRGAGQVQIIEGEPHKGGHLAIGQNSVRQRHDVLGVQPGEHGFPHRAADLQAALVQGDLNVRVGLRAGHRICWDGDHRQHGAAIGGYLIGQESLHGDIRIPRTEGDGLGQVHADAPADAQDHVDLLFRTQTCSLLDLAQQRFSPRVQWENHKPHPGQRTLQRLIVSAGEKTPRGDDQHPLAQLRDLLRDPGQLLRAVKDADAALIDEILHPCCSSCAAKLRPI